MQTWWICATGVAFAGGPWYLFDESWKPNRDRIMVVDGDAHSYLHKQTFISWAWGDGPAVIAPPRGARCWIQTPDPLGEFDARSWQMQFFPRDVNMDGAIDSRDILDLLRWIKNGERRGDFNADGVVNDADGRAWVDAGK